MPMVVDQEVFLIMVGHFPAQRMRDAEHEFLVESELELLFEGLEAAGALERRSQFDVGADEHASFGTDQACVAVDRTPVVELGQRDRFVDDIDVA
jgi:hypothetical protein